MYILNIKFENICNFVNTDNGILPFIRKTYNAIYNNIFNMIILEIKSGMDLKE